MTPIDDLEKAIDDMLTTITNVAAALRTVADSLITLKQQLDPDPLLDSSLGSVTQQLRDLAATLDGVVTSTKSKMGV